MLIFNVYAVLSIGLGALVGWGMFMSGQQTLGIVAGALVAACFDLIQRFGNRERVPFSFLDPLGGGHLQYIPVWLLASFGLCAFGMVKMGAVEMVGRIIEPKPAKKQRPEEKPVDNPPKPQGVEKPKPTRPSFTDAPVTTVMFDRGAVRIEGDYSETDAFDRATKTPVKIWQIALQADQAYWLEVAPTFNWFTHGVRIEDLAGNILTQATQKVGIRQSARQLFISPRTDSFRIIVYARDPKAGGFALRFYECLPGDTLSEFERIDPVNVGKEQLQIAAKTEPFLAAAISPDCQSAWVSYPGGDLKRFSCPGFQLTGMYRLPTQAYELAMTGNGLLCAAVQRVNPVGKARPWDGLTEADIHLYDTTTFTQNQQDVTARHVVSLGSVLARLSISSDDSWLYFLDTKAPKLGRINLMTGQLDLENSDIAPRTNAICLTADGKTLYSCASSNVVQKIDPITLKVVKTVHLEQGTPIGLQATNDGNVFLNSGERSWTHIFLVNVERNNDGEIAKAIPWAGVYHLESILLSPDQTTLFGACFSLSPSKIRAFHVPPHLPAFYKAVECGSVDGDGVATRGTMAISRDGGILLSDRGLFLTLKND